MFNSLRNMRMPKIVPYIYIQTSSIMLYIIRSFWFVHAQNLEFANMFYKDCTLKITLVASWKINCSTLFSVTMGEKTGQWQVGGVFGAETAVGSCGVMDIYKIHVLFVLFICDNNSRVPSHQNGGDDGGGRYSLWQMMMTASVWSWISYPSFRYMRWLYFQILHTCFVRGYTKKITFFLFLNNLHVLFTCWKWISTNVISNSYQ